MTEQRTWDESTWPMPRADIDSIYQAITQSRIAGRWQVIGVQVPGMRVNTDLMDDEWRLFGIDWVISSEPLPDHDFRLIYDSGPSTQHHFHDREPSRP